MNGEKLLKSMSFVDEKYIAEAEGVGKAKRSHWTKFAVAACLCVVVAAAVAVGSLGFGIGRPNECSILVSENPSTAPTEGQTFIDNIKPSDGTVTNEPTTSPSENAAVLLEMSKIFLNEQDSLVSDMALYYDPELYEFVDWNSDDILSYYGRSFAPAYLPEDIEGWESNETSLQVVVSKEDGHIAQDAMYLNFKSAIETESLIKRRINMEVTLTQSMRDCIYMTDSTQLSDICGTEVIFGHCVMTMGPYDPETHEPSEYYDVYLADFELDGAKVSIVADKVTFDEIIKITASIITGASEFEFAE